MQKLDRLSKVGIVAIIVIALVGGAGVWWWSKQPLESAKADPPVAVSSAPAPPPSCEPGTDPCTPEVAAEQAELKRLRAEAEQAQRTVFAERVRLANEGGALEPSDVLVTNTSGKYLDMAMALLRDQKSRGVTAQGVGSTSVAWVDGDTSNKGDPRLTMMVCEDNSAGSFVEDGASYRGNIFKGKVFAAEVDGRVKLVNASMTEVQSCD